MFIDYAALVTTQTDPTFLKSKTAHIEKNMGFPEGFVKVVQNKRDAEIPKRGLFNAHRTIYQTAVDNNYKHTLLFQDDVYFLEPIKEEEYAKFLNERSPEDWDIFYLGHRSELWEPRYIKKTNHKNVVKVMTNDLHAYIISQPCAKKMAALEWQGISADYTLRWATDNKAYASFPMKAIQGGRISSPAFMNGVSERNSQYIRYVTKKPFNFFDSIYYTFYMIINQPFFFLSSLYVAFFHNNGE